MRAVGRRTRLITLALAASALGTAACADDGGTTSEGDAPVALRGELELTLGATDSSPAYEFSRISGLAVDTGGRIFVADLDAAEVRVFTPQGMLDHRIGRKGQGPGELVNPCCLALQGSELWVRDNGNARYNVYTVADTGSTFRRAVRLAHTDQNRWAPLTFDPAGNVIDIGSTMDTVTRRPVDTRFHVDTNGTVVARHVIPPPPEDSVPLHTVNRMIGENRGVFFLYQPYGPAVLNAHGPNGERARAVSSRYSIAWYDPDGTLRHAIARPLEGPALVPSELARAESSVVNDMRRLNLSRQDIPYSVPDRKPPLRRIFFDRDGRLWVELSVSAAAPRRADVYDRDGRLAHTVEWPAAVDLSADGAIRGNIAHGIMRDSLDVERVVRMRLK